MAREAIKPKLLKIGERHSENRKTEGQREPRRQWPHIQSMCDKVLSRALLKEIKTHMGKHKVSYLREQAAGNSILGD